MWREIIQAACADWAFASPASDASLAEIEAALGVALPEELSALLRETDGVSHREYGYSLLWSAKTILEQNLEFRSYPDQNELYMPFDPLLFFAEAGNGDQFFFPIQAGGIHRADIFVWDHETDSRTWIASNLQSFIDRWGSGVLSV